MLRTYREKRIVGEPIVIGIVGVDLFGDLFVRVVSVRFQASGWEGDEQRFRLSIPIEYSD